MKYRVSYNLDIFVDVEADSEEEAVTISDSYLDDLPLSIESFNYSYVIEKQKSS